MLSKPATDLRLVDVDDPTWAWKVIAGSPEHMDAVSPVEGAAFNFNDPPAFQRFVRQDSIQPRNGITAPSATPVPVAIDATQTARPAVLEPMPTDIRYQNFASAPRAPSHNQAFLEEALAAVRSEHPPAQQPFLNFSAETTAVEPQQTNAQEVGFDFYFPDTPDGPWVEVDSPIPQSEVPPQRSLQPRRSRVDAGHIGFLMFILEQLEEYERHPDVGNDIVLAQRIAQANSLSREEFDALRNKAKARIDALAEQVHSSSASASHGHVNTTIDTPIPPNEPFAVAVERTLRCDLQSPQSVVPIPGQGPLSLDASVSALFSPHHPWEDSESPRWDPPSPDPTARTFFPEIDLLAVP